MFVHEELAEEQAGLAFPITASLPKSVGNHCFQCNHSVGCGANRMPIRRGAARQANLCCDTTSPGKRGNAARATAQHCPPATTGPPLPCAIDSADSIVMANRRDGTQLHGAERDPDPGRTGNDPAPIGQLDRARRSPSRRSSSKRSGERLTYVQRGRCWPLRTSPGVDC